MAYHGLSYKGNTREVFHGQQANNLFDNFISTIEHFLPSNQLLICLYTVNVSPSTDQLTCNIMNINQCDIIMLPGFAAVTLTEVKLI